MESIEMRSRRPGRLLAVIVAGVLVAVVVRFNFPAAIDQGKRRQHAPAAVGRGVGDAETIPRKYGVEVFFGNLEFPVATYHGPIQAANVDTALVDRYRAILEQEFMLYPPEFIRRSQLKRIVLCQALSFNGQNRAAVPDFEHDTLYLDVAAGSATPKYQRSVIHHDFFHMIDYRDDGQLYVDEGWARLNPRSFRYGNGGGGMQNDPKSGLQWDEPGFLTRYATASVEEDKAEVFAHMMTERAVVVERAKTDPVIHAKVSAIKALVSRFCLEMNDAFWEELGVRQSRNIAD